MSEYTLNIASAARSLGVSVREIRKWASLGMPYQKGESQHADRFSLPKIFTWHSNFMSGATGDEGKMTGEEAKRRKLVAEALASELTLAIKRGEVAPIDFQIGEFVNALTGVRASLMSMPARLSGLLAHQDDDVIADILTKDIAETLVHLSEYQHE